MKQEVDAMETQVNDYITDACACVKKVKREVKELLEVMRHQLAEMTGDGGLLARDGHA